MKLALKIDVDTLRGTIEGVPRLIKLLERYKAGATFLFSLGPDHTGRAIRRIFRRGFFGKVRRTSVLEHYGLQSLLYGTLLPGPDIGRRCAQVMRAVREAGFETGMHCWDHVRWQDQVRDEGEIWTAREMGLAYTRYESIFGEKPWIFGAAGWQTNRHAAAFQSNNGFICASDTRGSAPFNPAWGGKPIGCVQLPTTLPTLDELIGLDGVTAKNAPDTVLKLSAKPLPLGHVFTAHAELEGRRLSGVLEALLQGWTRQGYEVVPLGLLARTLDRASLSTREVEYAAIPGRSGQVAVAGLELPAKVAIH